jgi:pyruvate/2-oxoglutarate dehydrogenase complex dihydrolipoamide acyltransferase (E2) component
MSENKDNLEVTADGKRIAKKLPFTGVRRTIANNLINSWETAVTVSGFSKLDATRLVDLKNKLSETQKVTYTEIFIKIVAEAAKRHPIVNAALVDKKIELYDSVNVGVAVGTPDGMLYVPVIRDADQKSVFEISAELKDVVQRILNKTVTHEDLMGGTITLSSLGMFDSYGGTQVLVSPQVMILSFGRIRKEPVVLEDDSIGIRHMMYISNSLDHRVVQGEQAAQFVKTIGEIYADPEPYMGL